MLDSSEDKGHCGRILFVEIFCILGQMLPYLPCKLEGDFWWLEIIFYIGNIHLSF